MTLSHCPATSFTIINPRKSIFGFLNSFKQPSTERLYCSVQKYLSTSLFASYCRHYYCAGLESSQPSSDCCFLYFPNNYWQILKKFSLILASVEKIIHLKNNDEILMQCDLRMKKNWREIHGSSSSKSWAN